MNVKQTLEQAIYGYDPNEFMPIRDNGELQNKGEFVAYKAEQFGSAIGHLARVGLDATVTAGRVIIEHIGTEV